jgi:hypothetical protein
MLKTHISITDAERAVEEIARLKRSMRCSTRLTKPPLFLAPERLPDLPPVFVQDVGRNPPDDDAHNERDD